MATRSYNLVVGVETDDLGTNAVLDSTFVSTKTNTNYTVLDDDDIGTLLVSTGASDRTMTLPTAADNSSRRIVVKKIDSGVGVVIIDPEGAETIEGIASGTVSLYNINDAITVQCDGSGWHIVSKIPPQRIQDFTTVGSVGDSDQQYAGHIFGNDDDGAGSDISYYKFASGALTTDEQGTYTLTNNGAATNTTGILNTNFATSLNGSTQYYTEGTGWGLDTMATVYSVGFVFDCFFQVDDGQPAAINNILYKINTGGSADYLILRLLTDGVLEFNTSVSSTVKAITHNLTLDNGVNGWNHVMAGWNTTTGISLYVNGILVARDSSATTLMADGTNTNGGLGSNDVGGDYFDGKIAQVRFRNLLDTEYLAQRAYATRYTPTATMSGKEYRLDGKVQLGGVSGKENIIDLEGLTVSKDSNYIYRSGGANLGSTDKLSVWTKE
jgi:hypothetical protein